MLPAMAIIVDKTLWNRLILRRKRPFLHVNYYFPLLMTPVASLQCWLLEEDTLVNSSMTFSSASSIATGVGRRDLSLKFPLLANCFKSFFCDCSYRLSYCLC